MTFLRIVTAAAALCGVASLLSTASASGGARSILTANHALFQGQSLVSDACNYHLDMQWDGNLVLYQGVGNQPSQARWSTAQATTQCDGVWGVCEWNLPLPFGEPTYAILQGDGNFVEYDTAGALSIEGYPNGVRWDAGSVINTQADLWMQDDGNLVVYPAAHAGQAAGAAWASNTVGSTAPGPRNCPLHTSVTRVVQNTFYAGNTILHDQCMASSMACGDLCTGSSGGTCAGWSWVPDASNIGLACPAGLGDCILLSAVGSNPVYAPGWVTGVIEHP
jgi:hypothetical protein